MPITEAEFPERLIEAVPETQDLVEEHLRDEGELLLHILMADIRRFIIEVFERGDDQALVERCLAFIDMALREGDPRVQNAVGISFVEDTPVWDPEMEPFIASWPDALRAEAVSHPFYWNPGRS